MPDAAPSPATLQPLDRRPALWRLSTPGGDTFTLSLGQHVATEAEAWATLRRLQGEVWLKPNADMRSRSKVTGSWLPVRHWVVAQLKRRPLQEIGPARWHDSRRTLLRTLFQDDHVALALLWLAGPRPGEARAEALYTTALYHPDVMSWAWRGLGPVWRPLLPLFVVHAADLLPIGALKPLPRFAQAFGIRPRQLKRLCLLTKLHGATAARSDIALGLSPSPWLAQLAMASEPGLRPQGAPERRIAHARRFYRLVAAHVGRWMRAWCTWQASVSTDGLTWPDLAIQVCHRLATTHRLRAGQEAHLAATDCDWFLLGSDGGPAREVPIVNSATGVPVRALEHRFIVALRALAQADGYKVCPREFIQAVNHDVSSLAALWTETENIPAAQLPGNEEA